mgnify:CR=1 FL=1
MKRFFRGIFFYTVALFVASLIIPGFKLSTDIRGLLLCGFVLAILFMFVDPFFKLLLLPLNIMTMGLISVISQLITFSLFVWLFPNIIHINAWYFSGFSLPQLGIKIGGFMVAKFLTIVSATFIISLMVTLLSFVL